MAEVVELPRLAPLVRHPGVVACRSADGLLHVRTLGRGDGTSAVLPGTRMYAASLAKQVIGILIAQQCARGALAPAVLVRDLLPEWPSWAHGVTVTHLLHHTSGLPPLEPRSDAWSNTEVLTALRGAPGAVAPPGVTFSYSNIGFICLAEILTQICHRPVSVLASDLFAELGMWSSTLDLNDHMTPDHIPPPRTLGDGGFWTTAVDLLRWNDAMNTQVLGEIVHQYTETRGELDDGTLLDYAWGIRVLGKDRRRIISHGGSWPTWTAKCVRRPEVRTSVALLSSSDEADAATDLCLTLLDRLG